MTWAFVAVLALLVCLLVYELFLAMTGRLTLDTGWGRVTRQLGPRVVSIAAPRTLVFDQVSLPYLSPHPPRRLREKIEVLERGDTMVLAAHRTRVGFLTSVTVEAVRFEPPERVSFRLVRGPVPYAAEEFRLEEAKGATVLTYAGELGADFWIVGRLTAALAKKRWEAAVAASLEELKDAAEAAAARSGSRAS